MVMTERFYLSFSPHRSAAGCESANIDDSSWFPHLRISCPAAFPVPLKPRRHVIRVSGVVASVIAEEHVDIVRRGFLPPIADLARRSPVSCTRHR